MGVGVWVCGGCKFYGWSGDLCVVLCRIPDGIRDVRHLYPGSDNAALNSIAIALDYGLSYFSIEIPDFTIIHHTSQPGRWPLLYLDLCTLCQHLPFLELPCMVYV